jgi:hypothetical protein
MKDSSITLILSLHGVLDKKRRTSKDSKMRQTRSSSSVEVW